ncbi:MmgE/PrpD family protein [bacterium]|nr:MmgE/PrpD family protein [bacterium]
MPLLNPLAEFIADLSFDDLPTKTIEKTESHIFDSLGAVLSGASSEDARAACDLVKKLSSIDGNNDIPVPGLGFSAPLPYAVLISCVSARMTEIDDIHLHSCTTPGSIIVPTALMSAYYAGESGKRVFEGILAGYDVMTRLGASVNGPEILYRGIWPTYLCGAICAATIGSKIFGLNKEQIKHALAISLTMSTGMAGKIMTGLTSRWLTLGGAVQNGLKASLAAEAGFAGDTAILDGPFASAYGLDLDPDILLGGLGEKFRIEEISMKPHCTARQALSPTEAFRWLINTHQINAEEIEDIQVTIPQQYSQMIDRPNFPEARMPSIVSVQYQMALAAFYEEDLYDLRRINLRDEEKIHAFIKKVHVESSPDYTALFPQKWPGKITLRASGKIYEHEVLSPKGDPELPLAWSEVEQKIIRANRDVMESATVKKMGESVKELKRQPVIKEFLENLPVTNKGTEP